MARYTTSQIITAEFREDSGIPHDKIVTKLCLDHVTGKGLTPISDPVITWHEITQLEVDIQLASYLPYGIEKLPFRAGDWRVRCVLDVAEEPPQ